MNPLILATLINAGVNAVASGMNSGSSSQERLSFEGTGADPVEWLSDARGSIGNLLRGATQRLNEPIDLSASLPMSPMSVPTGFPPRTVGGFPSNNGQVNRVKFAGFGLDPLGVGVGARDASNLRGHAQRNTRNPNQVASVNVDTPGSQVMRRTPTVSGQPTTTDPSAVGAARLFLHSVFSQQQPQQPQPGANMAVPRTV